MPPPENITSPANPLLKEIRKALARGGRTEDGCSVTETFHLLEEAVRSRCGIDAILATEQAWPAVETLVRTLRGSRTIVLPDGLFGGLSSTETSQGVMALIRLPEWDAEELLRGDAPVMVLDGIQDPGNAGTIVRAAEAFGAAGVVFVKGTVSPYNPKTLRASAGSLFRLPFVEGLEAEAIRSFLADRSIPVYAAAPSGGLSLHEADLTRCCAIVIGSEGKGIGKTLQMGATLLRIPTVQVESLNAAMAASVILYEANRQKMVIE